MPNTRYTNNLLCYLRELGVITFSCPSVKWNISIKADSPILHLIIFRLAPYFWMAGNGFVFHECLQVEHNTLCVRVAGRRWDRVVVTSFFRRNTCVRVFTRHCFFFVCFFMEVYVTCRIFLEPRRLLFCFCFFLFFKMKKKKKICKRVFGFKTRNITNKLS